MKKGGRKNLKRAAAEEHSLTLEDGQSVLQVVSLRGSNLIEVCAVPARLWVLCLFFGSPLAFLYWYGRIAVDFCSSAMLYWKVMDARGKKSLALFPAKFQKSMWIKRGSFVVVDESGKEKALESGSKVACIVSQVLFYEQVRTLQRSPQWPKVFRSTDLDDNNGPLHIHHGEMEEDELDDDGYPPLEANMNRIKPPEFDQHDGESDLESDRDSL